jgi:phosphohistidine phosphatase SixA
MADADGNLVLVQVFLIRHADTVAAGYLSPRGRERARSLADRLRWHDCAPTRIVAASTTCAIQMAELMAAGVESVAWVEILEDAQLAVLRRQLAELPPTSVEVVMVVADEPTLMEFAEAVVGRACVPLAHAQAARIVDGRLKWRFTCDGEAPVTEIED